MDLLKDIASIDKKVKIIVNTRNFGHIRSPFYAILQSKSDALISMAADMQDPPQMLPQFLEKWEEGYKIVIGIKTQSKESPLMFFVRKLYYDLIGKLSEIEHIKNFTGFGLYDKIVIETLKNIDDPYPYFRGLICDLGYKRFEIKYTQNKRERGITKNNFYILYDLAMLGITNHSKVPLRLATFLGFTFSAVSFVISVCYLIYKLLFWDKFELGLAPLILGIFFFSSIQLFFIGILGEYIGSIHTQILKRPMVIEKERINFDE